jgi:arylsulfatase A
MTRFSISALLILVCAAHSAAENHTNQPNIVLVLFDDIGYGQPTSFRVESEFRMPNLDQMAAEGMRFTDAHSAAANCTPTRYGLLTGRYPFRIGQFGVLKTYSPPIIPSTQPTVASFLKQHGYHTACIGKWHLGMNWVDGEPGPENQPPIGARHTGGPNEVGFDYFYGFTHARNIGSIIEQDRVVANVDSVENQPLMIQKATQYLEQRASKEAPFFLYFPMCPPHNPIVPAPNFVGKGGIKGKESRYSDWVFQGDHMLGQILDTLKRTGLSENTLVIATGDNGAAKRDYPPLRDSKSSIYEGGHREPFVALWPGKIQPNTVNQQTICLNDLFATCADLLQVQLPKTAAEDSVSILPYLFGTATKPVREATVHQSPAGLAIRKGEWKMIFHRSGKRELFNLESDLSETEDCSATHVAIREGMTELLQSYIDRGRSTPGPKRKNDFKFSLSFQKLGE